MHSDESVHPGFVTDRFSAFYPLGASSPVMRGLELERHGLTWAHAPSVLAHVFPDDRAAVLDRDRALTAASIDSFAAGDGDAWLELVDQFDRISEPLLRALFTPFPPVRAGARLAHRLGLAELVRFARFAVMPVRTFATERFRGDGAAILLAGNALHADLSPEGAGSALYGWLLAMLGQTVGFPVPVGGSGRLTESLVRRLTARGGEIRLSTEVAAVDVRGGVATGVRTSSGERITTRAVLADVSVPALYRDLVGFDRLPDRFVSDLANFHWDASTFKVNWALSAPIPWTAAAARGAGTVHLGVDLNGLTRYAADLATETVPADPFLLLGQMTTADATRSPSGTESAWAYTHVPVGARLSSDEVARHVDVIEASIERNAPGFRASVIARSVQAPLDLQSADANLHGGAVSGGTAGIFQQLIFRPVPGLARAETPIDRLYLASAGAHPGGGVHGAPGANAARAALSREAFAGSIRRRGLDAALRRI